MNAFRALVHKDLVQFFANRRAVIMSLAAPVAIAALVGLLFSPASQKPTRVPVAVTDLDDSALSRQIVSALQADPTLQIDLAAQDAGEAAVRAGKVRVAVVLPQGFGAAAPRALFGAGSKPVVTIRHDPSQAIALALVRGALTQQVMQAVSQAAFSPTTMASMQQDAMAATVDAPRRQDLQQLFDSLARVQRGQAASAGASAASGAAAAPVMKVPFDTDEHASTAERGSQYNAYSHAFAGMGVQFILFAGIEFGVGLLLARRLGLWKRLRVAPLSRTLLLGSRLASGALISLLLLLAIFAAGALLFSVRINGSVVGFIAIAIAFALMTASFGLLLAAIGRSPETTRGLAIFATLLMVMLGGAWLPSFLFPAWLQTASLVMPTRWAVDGLDAMTWRGLGFDAAVAPTTALLGFALLFALLAVWRFDWEE